MQEMPVQPEKSVEHQERLTYNKDREGAGDGDPDWIIKK
jgi:hypothetical protein